MPSALRLETVDDDPLWYDRIEPDEPAGRVLTACAAVIFGLVDAVAWIVTIASRFAATLLEVEQRR